MASNDSRGIHDRYVRSMTAQSLSQFIVLRVVMLYFFILTSLMGCVERDVHCWNALSIHLLTKDNTAFKYSREVEVDKVIENLRKHLEPLGAPGLTTFSELRRIVLHAADIGLQIAQLPFSIVPWEVQLGTLFKQKFFEDIDDLGFEVLELRKAPIELVVFPPIVKLQFDSGGKMMDPMADAMFDSGEKKMDLLADAIEAGHATIISKGRAVCRSDQPHKTTGTFDIHHGQ